MEKILLLGNGINKLNNEGGDWGELISIIAMWKGGQVPEPNKFKPLPLYLEEIALIDRGDYDDKIKEAKLFVRKTFGGSKPNRMHFKIMDSSLSHILTTNYDYNLEKCIVPRYFNDSPTEEQTTETLHSLRRKKYFSNRKTIWHIHGEINQVKGLNMSRGDHFASSIMIGYDHYAKYLAEVQRYISGSRTKSDISLQEKLTGHSNFHPSWIDFFFTHDIIIVGFGFDFSEFHLWWLINYRAIEMNKNKNGSGILPISNKITFVYPEFERTVMESLKIKARKELLDHMNVKAKPIHVRKGNYEEFYEKVIVEYIQ